MPKNPVLLVHGYLGNGVIYWNVMTYRLRRDGFRCYTLTLPLFAMGDIRVSAEAVKKKVEDIKAETGCRKVNLVGHSVGGLICRYYIKFLEGVNNVSNYVSLGTPHHGTYLGYAGWLTTAGRQMVPGSDFLKELNAGEETIGNVKYTSIYSLTDEAVIPQTNSFLEGAENKVVALCGHLGLLVHPLAYRWTKEALK